MSENYKKKTVKGVSWNIVEQLGLQGIRLVMGIVLARLLTPADFGLIGMMTVFFAIADILIQGGLGIAYIQKKHVTDTDANTVFFTNLVISIILYFVLWVSAPLIANFYNQPKLIQLTKVMGLVVIINAFNIIQLAQIRREINFKRKTKVTLISTIISGTAGVLSAVLGLGVWSLVIQQLTNRFITTVILSITNKWTPSLKFSIESLKSMFGIGAWELLSGVISTIFDNIYILVIGKFFPAAQLGFYTKAKQFKNLASNNLVGSVGSVAFPVLSRFQNDKVKIKNSMEKFIQYSFFLTAPVMTCLLVISKPFVIIFLTDKWAPIIIYLQLMCIGGMFYPLHIINLQILTALGKTKLGFHVSLIKNSFRVINIIVMYRWGVLYIIIGELLLSFVSLYVNSFYTNRLVGYNLLSQLNSIKYTIFSIVIAGIISYFISISFGMLVISLLLGIIAFSFLYLFLQYIFNKNILFEFLGLIKLLRA